jgi:hypothetical protein
MWTAAALLTVPLLATAKNGEESGVDPCVIATIEATKACRQSVISDLWRERAVCTNLPSDEVGKCRMEVLEDARASLAECALRRDARREVCTRLGGGSYYIDVDPNDFLNNNGNPIIDNPYLPLLPGRTLVYEVDTDEGLERIEVTTTRDTVEILGVTCRVVRDTVSIKGELLEDTYDWFAQDTAGNVWYFGELSFNYEDGEIVDIEGSWKAGEDGAQPGIVMPANPMLGDFNRQEYLILEAEDVAGVVGVDETVVIDFGTYNGCLKTEDWTPIEPDGIEHKFYAPAVGLVLETKPDEKEQLELVEIRTN